MMEKLCLITGSSGNVGGACAHYLLASGAKVRCFVRSSSSEKAQALKDAGAELAEGDFADTASVARALEGTTAVLLACSNQLDQVALETNFINAAAEFKGSRYLVKLSTCGAPGYCEAGSAIEYGRSHAAIEAVLEAKSGLDWTILQPNCFMQNHAGDIFGSLPHRVLAYPRTASQLETGAARIVDTRDVGEVAAKLLLLDERSGHAGQRYHVCGPTSCSVRSLAATYEAALGLPAGAITCVEDMSEAAYAEGLEQKAGFPSWLAVAVARNQGFWAEGKLDYPSSDAVLALHPTFRTMESWVAEHAPLVHFAT